MLLYGFAGIYGVRPKRWLRQGWWLAGIAWVMLFALSAYWNPGNLAWDTRVQVKLPILLLPLSATFLKPFSDKQYLWFTGVLNAAVIYGIGYSLYAFSTDPDHFIAGYQWAHVLPTVPENDHVRFSLFVALAVAWNLSQWPMFTHRWIKIGVVASCVIFIAYLHLLAARTGLLALYILLFGWIAYLLVNRKTRFVATLALVGMPLFLSLAVAWMPTLRTRIHYVLYAAKVYREEGLQANYSDLGRLISYDVAWRVIQQHPVGGVGPSQLLPAMRAGYRLWYPGVAWEEMLVPHNQLLLVLLCCGTPGGVLFVLWLLYPLSKVRRTREGLFFVLVWLMLMAPILVEPMLEVQFGVFTILFFLSLVVQKANHNLDLSASAPLDRP